MTIIVPQIVLKAKFSNRLWDQVFNMKHKYKSKHETSHKSQIVCLCKIVKNKEKLKHSKCKIVYIKAKCE